MKKGKLAVALSILSLFLYPLSDILCVGVSSLSLVYAVAGVRECEVTVKVIQPALVLGFVYALRGVFALIINTIVHIANFGSGTARLYHNINGFNRVVSIICLILVFIHLVLTLVFFSLNKDVPVAGEIASSLAGERKRRD